VETLQTGLRAVLRILFFIAYVLVFFLVGGTVLLINRDPIKRLRASAKTTSFFCGFILKVFNVKVIAVNRPDPDKKFLLVSNHMGFLDILVTASVCPMIFITSIEMKQTPFLGTITDMAGCMYVERRSRTKILDEMKSMVDALKGGVRIVLYPEATSTNGEQVLPFKRTLMMAAAHAEVPIQPAVVNFRSINGDDFNMKWRDSVCWYGDISFPTSLWRACSLKSVVAEIEFLQPIYATVEDDRGLIADRAHAAIAAKFVPVKGLPQEETAPVEMQTEV
jgi:1-acyl-sn-glycerol-3-phosphate acyltransferase